jgi:cold shock CspA family protein
MNESQYRVEWMEDPEEFRGDISATVSVEGHHWREIGAQFSSVEDEQTGPVDLAAGTVEFPGGAVQFGLLDYGSDVTYLLTPVSGRAKEELATLALLALAEAGALSLDDVLEESNPYEEPSLTERVTVLEQWAGEAIAEAESTAVPVAVDVEIPAEYPSVPPGHIVGRRLVSGESTRLRHVGTIKVFNAHRGGLISPQGGGKEIFVHPASINNLNAIAAGAKVTFRYAIEPGGGEGEPGDPGAAAEVELPEEA